MAGILGAFAVLWLYSVVDAFLGSLPGRAIGSGEAAVKSYLIDEIGAADVQRIRQFLSARAVCRNRHSLLGESCSPAPDPSSAGARSLPAPRLCH